MGLQRAGARKLRRERDNAPVRMRLIIVKVG